jgi:hypothetical protein
VVGEDAATPDSIDVDGPTPAGGVRSRMVFVDAEGTRVKPDDPSAVGAVIEELDEDDNVIATTHLAVGDDS